MNIVEINQENIQPVYDYFLQLKKTTPYIHSVSLAAFTNSLLNDHSEGEMMFKELHTYAAIETNQKVTAIIQYGIPNYEIKYDGERYFNSSIGVIRCFYTEMLHADIGIKLYKKAMEFFKANAISKVYAFSNDYGMSVYGYQGKLFENERTINYFLRLNNFKPYVTSLYYTISLKRMKDYLHDDHINFVADELIDNHQFFTIKKHNTEIGGMEVYYINNKTINLSFFYILDDYRGRSWGHQALLACLMMFKRLGYDRIDADLTDDNSIAIRLFERCKLGKLGKAYSYIKEI